MKFKRVHTYLLLVSLVMAIILSGCTTTIETTATPDFSGCDSGAITLELGETVNDQLTQERSIRLYCLYVPSGTGSVTVTLTGLSEDFDIYIHKTIVAAEEYIFWWWSSNTGSADESLVIDNPDQDIYYVRVDSSYKIAGDYTLLATAGAAGTTTTTTPAGTTTTTTMAVSGQCDPRATTLTSGVKVDNQISKQDDDSVYYCIYVPDGTETLLVRLADMNEDFNLYTDYGSYDALFDFNIEWYSSEFQTDPDEIKINYPQQGYYYIEVYDAYDVGGSYSITATVTDAIGPTPDPNVCDSRATSITAGTPVNGHMSTSDKSEIYCIYMPDGTDSLTVTLTNLNGNLDIYLGEKYYLDIIEHNTISFSDNGSNQDESLAVYDFPAGAYYIEVYNDFNVDSSYALLVTFG